MALVLRYRGRDIHTEDVESIEELLAAGAPSRRTLSQQVCRSWGWVQPNGRLCDATCRKLLLALHRAGHITLPPPRWASSRPPRRPGVPLQPVEVETSPVRCSLRDLGPLALREVRYAADEQLVNGLVHEYHYLGYVQPVGEHLKYLVTAQGRPIACFCWSSAPRHLGPRDRHIGWSPEVRRANLRLVAYQTRFLILPWVQVPHLASHLLGRMSRQLSEDWERVYVHGLAAGIVGAVCALCGVGRVFAYRAKVIVRVIGQSLFAAQRHHFEQGRCRLCGAIFTAEGSELVVRGGIGTSYIVYDWSACAMLIVMHYFAGGPFKRLEALHQGWGVPMPDANQWRVVDECDDLLAPLYRALERHAIHNATSLGFDDTGSMIIDTRRQIHKELQALELLGESTKHVRTGINATGICIETAEAKVVLFFTGRHHAGEIVDRLLAHRRASANKVVAISDAASKNFAHDHTDELEQAVCNAHCYLKFRAIRAQFPAEYAVAGEVYNKVFDNDDKAKALGLDPRQRMLYHLEHSKPQMLRLWQMCKDKTDGKLVEPNSPLWEPVSFVINQWPRLSRFYEVPGVPLDSNLVEQALIIPVRYLAGSFAYKTQNGADVGDRHMSLIATANANGVEPVAYLTECLRNHEDLAKRPDPYLPWVYRDRLDERDRLPHAQAVPPSSSSPPPARKVQHPLRPGTHRAQRTDRPVGAAEPQPMVGLGPDG